MLCKQNLITKPTHHPRWFHSATTTRNILWMLRTIICDDGLDVNDGTLAPLTDDAFPTAVK